MIKKIKFTKMHGLGNDFVIINQQDLPANCDSTLFAKGISNRHTGIGCDQFIIYNLNKNYYDMIIYNIDGSPAKLCGNASRCLAKLIYLDSGLKNITLKVGNKNLACFVESEDEISVNIGPVSFQEAWMPSRDKIWEFAQRYMIDLKDIICVDVGNPHLIIFSNMSDEDAEVIGKKLQDKELFTDGVNVNFVKIKDDKIYLSVWERGAGLTLACGSGACASFAASVKFGFVKTPSEVVFTLGSLMMSKQGADIIMKGSASLVARGEFYYG